MPNAALSLLSRFLPLPAPAPRPSPSACHSADFVAAPFAALELPPDETLLGFTPDGEHLLTVASDIKYVHLYRASIASAGGGGQRQEQPGSQQQSQQQSQHHSQPHSQSSVCSMEEEDESDEAENDCSPMDMSSVSQSLSDSFFAAPPPPRTVCIDASAPALTLPAIFDKSKDERGAGEDWPFRFLQNDVAMLPASFLMAGDGGVSLASVCRAAAHAGPGGTPSPGGTGQAGMHTPGASEQVRSLVINPGVRVALAARSRRAALLAAGGGRGRGVTYRPTGRAKRTRSGRCECPLHCLNADSSFHCEVKEDEATAGNFVLDENAEGSSFMNLEPELEWRRFCTNCGNHKKREDTPARAHDSLEVASQSNISYEGLIRTVIAKPKWFRNKRLVDYAAEIAGADGDGSKVQIVLIIELDVELDAEQQLQRGGGGGGAKQLPLKGIVAEVEWSTGAVEVLQWVNPPAAKGARGGAGGLSQGSTGSSDGGGGSAKKSSSSSLHLQKLARSLVKQLRKNKVQKPSVSVLSNDAVLKGRSVDSIGNDAYSFLSVAMEGDSAMLG
ncbi:hypothetical protein TeGR_g2401 [Tetraparma gracilis]|uniref:Uncharacterized protein n=1 Tax=Tetraparma gracilis TaxID=2962635 RepID=A0ABQ6N732_9STRA|nr:hypothetical protein TeGR_g2401 [Tetraparma gracilis]